MAAAIEQNGGTSGSGTTGFGTAIRATIQPAWPLTYPAAKREQAVDLVIFVLGDRQFALEIRFVCEIVSRARCHPLPGNAPACLLALRPARSAGFPSSNLRGPLDLPQLAGIANTGRSCAGGNGPNS